MIKYAVAALLTIAAPVAAQTEDATIESDRITVQMVPGITGSNQLPTPELVNARKALTQGQSIPTRQLREIADLGDGFAAYRFAEFLASRPETSKLSDVAHYYGLAAATGRGGAIRKMIAALEQVDNAELPRARSDVLEAILFTYARAGNTVAIDAVTRFHASETPFGRLSTEIEGLLEYVEGDAAAKISLQLAVDILRNQNASLHDLERASAFLETASLTSSLEDKLVADNLRPILEQELAKKTVDPLEVSE